MTTRVQMELTAEPTVPVGLRVEAMPNPSDWHELDEPTRPPHENMWYYTTTVTNVADEPLCIRAFGAFRRKRFGGWEPLESILGRALTGRDFRAWYSEGRLDPDGFLAPGGSVMDPRNFHGGEKPKHPLVRWVYLAETAAGAPFCGWVDVESRPIRRGWYQAKPVCCRDDDCRL